jgi:hypothetical protein
LQIDGGLTVSLPEENQVTLPIWVDWSNTAVGGVGLLLTITAIVQATGAKQEAKEAIWQREASDSFSELEGIAGELALLLQLERPSEAVVRARDLAKRIPRDRARFERFLSADSDKLKALESEFQRLAVQLSSAKFLEEKGGLQVAIQAVFDSNRELNAIYGRLLAKLDEE